ncbi:Cilia- and flagella-associated protein 46 [Cichlidogyrus casuarinus]|uniref:Cilia- and flagella-associated protein 46 n=1 Tax=Cichlidogyrus casuarinus TaxID=1844966 RepID=A0ABD2QDS3_9PLAT
MVSILALAFANNLSSSERHLNWAIGSANLASKSQQVISATSLQMSGGLSIKLQKHGVALRSSLARLRFRIKSGVKQSQMNLKTELWKLYRTINGVESFQSSPSFDSVKEGQENTSLPTQKELYPETKAKMLLDLAFVGLGTGNTDLADDCARDLSIIVKTDLPVSELVRVQTELHFLNCARALAQYGALSCRNTKPIVELRHSVLERCQSAMEYAIRNDAPISSIHLGCAVIWSICAPLLQPMLRAHPVVRKSLESIIKQLSQINTFQKRLLFQAHFALALAQIDCGQLQIATENFEKALHLDLNGEFKDQLIYLMKKVESRKEIYKTPERPEDKARQLIEQVKSLMNGSETPEEPLGNGHIPLVIRKFGTLKKMDHDSTQISSASSAGLVAMAGQCLTNEFRAMLSIDAQITGNTIFHLFYESDLNRKAKETNLKMFTLLEVKQLSSRGVQWLDLPPIVQGYLNRNLSDPPVEMDHCEGIQLWIDIAKTSRKLKIWDCCRIACRQESIHLCFEEVAL